MAHVVLKDYPHHLTEYEGKGTSKIPIFKLISELGKIWRCSLWTNWTNWPLDLWTNWEKLCPNLIFIVENKMGNSHKKGWSHFKLNING